MQTLRVLSLGVVMVLVMSGCSLLDGTTEPTTDNDTPAVAPIAKTAPVQTAKPGMKVFADNTSAVSIQYPEKWELSGDNSGVIAMFLSEPENNDDQFRENVNVLSESFQGLSYTTQEYTDLNIETLKAQLTDFKQVSGKMVKVGKYDAYRLEYTGSYSENALAWTQWFYSINGTGYVITYTAEPGAAAKFLAPAESIVATFMVAE